MDAGHGAGCSAVDLAETGVGVGTAYESGMQRARQFHVIDELGPPRQQGRILETRDSCAELLRAQTPYSVEIASGCPCSGCISIRRLRKQGKSVGAFTMPSITI